MGHYGLQNDGLDTGALGTPDSMRALATFPQTWQTASGRPVITGAAVNVSTPYGGANVSGRISASVLALTVVALVAFYVKTKGMQL